jgi:hypothetical protein
MTTFVWRALATAITFIVAFLGIAGGIKTGNYSPLLMLVPCGLFWFLELRFTAGTTAHAFQYVTIRVLTSLVVVGAGVYLIYLGISELSEPVSVSRLRVFAYAVRALVGSEGLAALLFVLGAITVVSGLRIFPRGKRTELT